MKQVIKNELMKLTGDKMLVVCTSVGNPDFRQNPNQAISDPKYYAVDNFEQASAACQAYISFEDLGGGNWSGGDIYSGAGYRVAYVSYNGRVWTAMDKLKHDFVNSRVIETNPETVKKYYAHYEQLWHKEFEAIARAFGDIE